MAAIDNGEFILRLANCPRFSLDSQLRKEIAAVLPELGLAAIRKDPRRDYAFCSLTSRLASEQLLAALEAKQICLKGNILSGSLAEAQPANKRKRRQKEAPPVKSILDQVAPLHAMPYASQLTAKWEELRKQLPAELAAILQPVLPSPRPDGYRNKCEFSVGYDAEGQASVGFTAGLYRNGHIAVESSVDCPHVAQSHKQLAAAFAAYLQQGSSFKPFDRADNSGYWRLLIVRSNEQGELLVALQANPQALTPQQQAELKAEAVTFWAGHPTVRSLHLQLSNSRNHGVDPKMPFELLAGQPSINEQLFEGKLSFRISPLSFFQVNTLATNLLYATVRQAAIEGCRSDAVLLDLCCGTGTIGIALSACFASVIGIEMVPEAVQDAEANAAANGCANVSFRCAKLETCIEEVLAGIPVDKQIVAVLDPPRCGVPRSVLRALERCCAAGRISNIIFVSCSPAQARANFELLLGIANFEADLTIPVDLFPHTLHCELVTRFRRIK